MNRIKTKTRRCLTDVIGAIFIIAVGVALLAAYFDVLTK
jgi:hypothetical protein